MSTPTLPSEQRETLAQAGDHSPEMCDCDAYAPDYGYPDDLICDGLADTFAVVARMIADERERIAETLDSLALTMVSTASDEGTALTAAVLQRAARIVRGGDHA